MRYHITEHGEYIRVVIGDGADKEDFASFYKELQALCTVRGVKRAGVQVRAFFQETEGIRWLTGN